MAASAIPSTETSMRRGWLRGLLPARVTREQLVWLAVAVFAGAAAAAGIAPFLLLAGALLCAAAVGVLESPLAFLWLLTVLSGIGLGWTESAALQLGGRSININGLRWAIVMAADVIILIRLRAASLPRELRGWWWLVLLSGAGLLWTTDRFEGLKQWLLYAAPLLTAAVMLQVLRGEREIRLLRNALYVAVVAGALGMLLPALAGEPLDPDGRFLHRGFGMFLVPAVALSLARLKQEGMAHALPVIALFALTLGTQSRGALLAILVLVVVLVFSAGTPLRVRAGAIALLVTLVVLALTYQPVRERIFQDPRRGFTGRIEMTESAGTQQLSVGGLQLTGRGIMWLQTWRHAVRAPVLGQGTGSVTHFLIAADRGRNLGIFPHNEPLRVFHDFGIVGVAVLLAAFAIPLRAFRRLSRRARTPLARELALAAMLCWVAFAVIAMFDNPLSYFVFFTYNVFLVSVLAVRAAALEAAP